METSRLLFPATFWRSTYPISNFIADPEKRAEIEEAIKRYVAL
jgi:hypothetical protein